MIRTSISHPLQIASIPAGAAMGSIGITLCPGKRQSRAMSGEWQRDLATDLDEVSAWNAALVVTLVEDGELSMLGVRSIGDQVRARYMDWLHLPIPDVSIPGVDFENSWATAGAGIRARLRAGFNVLVHCKGGLGRAGTIAARLLVELGWEPTEAIRAVRSVRPGAIETPEQEQHVLGLTPVVETIPPTSHEAIYGRGLGSLFGLAVGDALGTTLEFKPRDSYPPLLDMVGGGPFRLEPGQWTDDTAMALALGDSLVAHPHLDEGDLMNRFLSWFEAGAYSCTGSCFDIGLTTRQALRRYKQNAEPFSGSSDPMSAGNGSLMRLAPVALSAWDDRSRLDSIATRQSKTTHAAPESVSACVLFAECLADAICGASREHVLATKATGYGAVCPVISGSWRGKKRAQIRSSGYVVHSLEAALWSIGRTSDFAGAVLLAANLGDDADTVAAIAGQLAGALYGLSGIPDIWLERLAWRSRIENLGRDLLAR